MAEGGDFSLLKSGSDAEFELTCTPCGEDNIREEAVKYCPECQEYLCVTCTRHHGRQRLSRSHKLLDKSDAKDASVVAMTAKCRYHPDRAIEMYCGTHDMVYCTKCIATEHRGCTNVKNIDELSQPHNTLTEIKRLQDESRNVHKRLIAKKKEKLENINSLEEQRREIQENLVCIGEKLKDHIDSLTTEATKSLNCKFTETRGELESDEHLITVTISDIEKSTNQLQGIPSMDVAHQFIYLKLVQKSIAEARILHGKNEAKGTKVLKLNENTDFSGLLLAGKDIGQVVVMSENQSQYLPKEYTTCKMKARKDICVRTESDAVTCFISGICQLQDGTILLTDCNNMTIKRLDGDYNVRDHCYLNGMPTGICCTGQNEVAVKKNNNKVEFITVGESLSKIREIAIEGGDYWGIVYLDDLWVSTGSGIYVYSTSGILQRTIVKDNTRQNIFKGATHYIAVSEDTVIVADFINGAVCLGRDGTVRKEVRDQRLRNTTGVCISPNRTVFLSGYSSHNVVYFSEDGKYHGELISEKDGITHPSSIWYDNSRNCIILACLKSSDFIHILELSD